jgi:hypothetical protein
LSSCVNPQRLVVAAILFTQFLMLMHHDTYNAKMRNSHSMLITKKKLQQQAFKKNDVCGCSFSFNKYAACAATRFKTIIHR